MSRVSSLGLSAVALGTLIVWGCSGGDLLLPDAGGAAVISVVDGDGQSGTVGSALQEALVVRVADRVGRPIPNQAVAFVALGEDPGVDLFPDTANTNADGEASSIWTLGETVGTKTVEARVVSSTAAVRFTAEAGPGPANALVEESGDGQAGTVGTELTEPLVVRVTDRFGNAVAGTTVEWSASSGTVDPVSTTSGEGGRAETRRTLGPEAGPQSATATSAGLSGSPVTFTHIANAGDPASLLEVSGNNQTGSAGAELSEPLVVRVVDAAGNGVVGQAVSWLVATGGGGVDPTSGITDADGFASARWTLGPLPGENTLDAVVSGVGIVGFTATASATAGPPVRLAFRVQPSDTEEDETIEPAVEVVVLTAAGDLVRDADLEVTLELLPHPGHLRGDNTARTDGGVARFEDLEVHQEGDGLRLRASAPGLPPVESEPFDVAED